MQARRHSRSAAVLVATTAVALLAGFAEPAVAQTREEEHAAAQAEKAKNLHPYEPTTVERRIQRIEKAFLNPPPVYVFLGSVFPGGLLAAGPGYRGRVGESGAFDVHAAWSLKNYKTVDGFVRLPAIADGRIVVDLRGIWVDAPKVAFYGVGNETRLEDKTTFLYRTTTAGASARVAPVSFVSVGGGLDTITIDARSGTGPHANPSYVRSRLFAEVDWRTSPRYTRRGGHYRADWSDYNETTGGPFSFRRVDVELDQFIPLLRENWVIALRALTSVTDTAAGKVVPFFLMPSLGGSSELRGYPSWRFRDRNRLLLTGEYRWMAGQFVDMALFLDAGKVADRRSGLDLNDLKTSYGIGARFHTPNATALRLEVARKRGEGIGIIFSFGPAF